MDELQIAAITEPLGGGQGSIDAKNHDTNDQARERAEQAVTYYEEVPAGRPVGCIDGRSVLETIDGQESLIGPKTAGGSAISGLFAYAMEGQIDNLDDAYTGLARVVTQLEEHGEAPARFHIDADHKEEVFSELNKAREKFQEMSSLEFFIDAVISDDTIPAGTGCGMGDQFTGAVSTMADRPRTFKRDGVEITETVEDVQARLEFMKTYTSAITSEAFEEATFVQQVENATSITDSSALNGFNEMKALIIVDRVLRDAGVENGVFGRLEVLATSDEGVHGHVEDGILLGKRKGLVFNLTKYNQETGGSYFSYEEWVKHPIAQAISTGISDYEATVQRNAQAIDSANVAAAFQLTNGSQRVIITE